MLLPSQLVPVSFSLAAACGWGTSDFLGGHASRRANAYVLATIAHAAGFVLMAALALQTHAALPTRASGEWAVAAGALGGAGLAVFYKALSTGKMGLTAPLVAVLSAGIPTAFAMITEGLPGTLPMVGLVLAGVGIWLISRTEGGGRFQEIALAILTALGFAGFSVCIKQAGNGSALWIAALSRASSFAVTGAIALIAARPANMTRGSAGVGILAGCLDVTGSALFVRAAQTGRLDTAVVLSSLYPAVTVFLARVFLKERFTRWKIVGILAALVAVPMIAQ